MTDRKRMMDENELRKDVMEALCWGQSSETRDIAERHFRAWKRYALRDGAERPEELCREIHKKMEARGHFEKLLAYWIPLLNHWFIRGAGGDQEKDYLEEGVFLATQSLFPQWMTLYFDSFYIAMGTIDSLLSAADDEAFSHSSVMEYFCFRMNGEGKEIRRRMSRICFFYIDRYLREEWELEAPDSWWAISLSVDEGES